MINFAASNKQAIILAKAQNAAEEFRRWGFNSYYDDEGLVTVKSRTAGR